MAIEAADLMRWKACSLYDADEPCGAEANMAKYLAAEASWKAANVVRRHPRRLRLRRGVRRRAQVPRDPPLPGRADLQQPHPGLRRPARAGHAEELLTPMNDFEALQQAIDAGGPHRRRHRLRRRRRRAQAQGRPAPTRSASTSTSPRAQQIDPDGRYLQGGAEDLPLEDQSVDVAILLKSLHHVPDPHSAFPELHRVVRGEVFIAEPLPDGRLLRAPAPRRRRDRRARGRAGGHPGRARASSTCARSSTRSRSR